MYDVKYLMHIRMMKNFWKKIVEFLKVEKKLHTIFENLKTWLWCLKRAFKLEFFLPSIFSKNFNTSED